MSKILVFGDSIAYGKWDGEGGWVARLRKYVDEAFNIGKGGNFQVYNLGIPGEVVIRTAERFESELKFRLPITEKTNKKNLVLLAIGINDSCPNNSMMGSQTSEIHFKKAFQAIIQEAQNQNCKVAVVGLTPVNPSKSKGLKFTDEEVKKYDQFISEICAEQQVPKLNVFGDLQKANFSDLLVDSVHPNFTGHQILTEKIIEFLKSQKLFDWLLS